MITFQGTAVKFPDGPDEGLVLTTLTLGDLSLLHQTGSRAVAMVLTQVVYRQETSWATRWAEGSLRNQELPEFSSAARATWRIAMEDLTRQAAVVGGRDC